MNGFPFFDSPIFIWVVIPVLIILARIVDVTLDTIRIIYISRGMKYLAPIFGFFEILIWLMAISQIMRNLNNPVYYLAYAIGFATGNLVGIFVEERLAVGRVVLRIITQKDTTELVAHLRSCGYGVTTVMRKEPPGRSNSYSPSLTGIKSNRSSKAFTTIIPGPFIPSRMSAWRKRALSRRREDSGMCSG